MTLATDIADDFVNVADGLETVTLKFPGAPSASAVTVTLGALRRAVRTGEKLASGGRYTTSDVTWHLDAGQVTNRPELGTRIVDSDGVYWNVIDVAKETLGSRWRCVCANLAIELGPATYVRIQRADWITGQAGAKQARWRDELVGARAWVKETVAAGTVENDAKITRRTVNVFLADELPDLTCDSHRVVDAGGTPYKIESIAPADLNSFQVLQCVEHPWPEA